MLRPLLPCLSLHHPLLTPIQALLLLLSLLSLPAILLCPLVHLVSSFPLPAPAATYLALHSPRPNPPPGHPSPHLPGLPVLHRHNLLLIRSHLSLLGRLIHPTQIAHSSPVTQMLP